MITVQIAAILGAAPALAQTTGLLGDPDGARTALGAKGVTLSVTDSENLLGDVSGGVKRGATLQGVTTVSVQVDTGKAFHLQGGTFNVSALQIHGRSLSPYYLDDLQAANGNEADDATRLWELWYDQSFDNSMADIKIGQQSIDNEFLSSQYSALFVNTMAGWPLVPSADLYAGGPAYPLSSLGGRIRFKPADNETILAGVFDDNPPGHDFDDDAQDDDAGGTRFNVNTGALFITEFQYVTNQPVVGQLVQSNATPAPSGTYKIGFWYDTAGFPDQEYGTDGLSLANPSSNGVPVRHRGNYSLYAVVDQTVWQPNSTQSVSVFGRVMGAPLGDENLISYSFNGGVSVAAPVLARANDVAGIDFGIGNVSSRAAGLDRDTNFYNGTGGPVRGTEELIELTYQAQATPWLVVQPDFQYVMNPGAGIASPVNPNTRLRNELVVGVRAVTTF
jgi:porin